MGKPLKVRDPGDRKRKLESAKKKFGLGRKPAPDPGDRGFLIRDRFRLRTAAKQRYWFSNAWWGDQKQTPQCVAYAWEHFWTAAPKAHSSPLLTPQAIYQRAQQLDEWPGENYDGTSVRGGAKAMVEFSGIVDEYLWAFEMIDVQGCLLTQGGVVLGLNWYEEMFWPDDDGFLVPQGPLAGGHALLADGINVKQRRVRLKNSWGRNWGLLGRAWIHFDDLERLLGEAGEACMAVEAIP